MGILDNAKQVAKAVEEIHNLELYQRVLGLHSDIIELVEENIRLRDENTALKKQQEIKGKLRLVAKSWSRLLLIQRTRPTRRRPILHGLLGHRRQAGQTFFLQ